MPVALSKHFHITDQHCLEKSLRDHQMCCVQPMSHEGIMQTWKYPDSDDFSVSNMVIFDNLLLYIAPRF